MPFVAMSLCLLLITAGISVDLMRAFECIHQLEFGAQTAALYGLSYSTNPNGSFSTGQAQTNILGAISVVANNAWNVAQAGAQNATGSKPVNFAPTQFVPNPLDPTEFFVQVTAQCIGANALQPFFIPLAYVGISGGIPAPVQQESLSSTVEVLGQPATRIGYGAPLGSAPGTRAGDLMGFATLPIAISNVQFAPITAAGQTTTTYTIDLVTSTSAEYTGPAPAGHIKGCLVNVAGTGNGNNFYGPAQGEIGIDQLEALLTYFGATSDQQAIAPAVVEQGSSLSGFDAANANNPPADVQELYNALSTLPAPPNIAAPHAYIIPVLAQDPSFTANNQVVGFAYLNLDTAFVQATNSTTLNTLTVDIATSVPVRNASSATGYSSIPGNTGNLMPAPLPGSPFLPRTVDPTSNGITIRPRSIVLAPAVSPRQLAPPIVPQS
jgi:hypothetical protein